jgi:hypothetical protein
MEMTEIKTTSPLTNKKVYVVPVKRGSEWLPKGHEAEFLFGKAYFEVTVPRKVSNGELVDPLTPEERAYFESEESNLSLKVGDLSIYKEKSNYWNKFRLKLDKSVLVLDLSNPMDYIKYKVLLTNKNSIAGPDDQIYKTHKFQIKEEGHENEAKVKSAADNMEAYKLFGKMEDSPTKMRNFLNVYQMEKPGGKSVPAKATREFLIAEVEKVVEGDKTTFLKILKDDNYEKKVLIYQALKAKALVRDGLKFKTPEDSIIGNNLKEAMDYLYDPLNSEELLKVKARIDNSK